VTDTLPVADYVVRRKPLWIYFLAVDGRLIKIGKSRGDRGVRLEQHRAPSLDGHIPNVSLLCEVQGCDADEKALHRHFAEYQDGVGAETFRAERPLVDYVRWLRDMNFVSVGDESDETRDTLPIVDSEAWMPRPGRVKPRDASLLPGMYPPFDLGPREVTIDDFYTNSAIIEAARLTMGGIDLDPASHALANVVVKATTFYTKTTNGLAHKWGGRVWLNPPFSAWAEWSEKILLELGSGRVTQMCSLAATRTITARYFTKLLEGCNAMCVTRGRIPFWGDRAGSPDDGHVIIYFGDRVEVFRHEFAGIGTVFTGPRGTNP
jgi:hypothetical protein